MLAVAFLVGAVPFSNLMARCRSGIDLRDVDDGTVSGTGLFRVAGFGPLAVAGVLDVTKGAVGPLLTGREHPGMAAAAGSAAVAGHNWSPFLGGAGGRGISPALGAFGVRHYPGAVVLLIGLVAGRLTRQTGLGSFVSQVLLVPVLARTHGRSGAIMGAGITVVMLAKRLAGNRPPSRRTPEVYLERLLFDRDPPESPESPESPDGSGMTSSSRPSEMDLDR